MARRRGVDWRRGLTLGGQAPASVGLLLVLMAVATVGGHLSPPLARELKLQVPPPDVDGLVVLLQAWRLVTWPFDQGPLPGSVLTLLFAGFMLLWLGRQLSYTWSERRFLVRFFLLTVVTGIATLVILTPFGWPIGYAGIWPVVNALLLTWGLLFPGQRISWFGALEMTGATVGKVIAIGTPAWALLVGPAGLGPLERLVLYLPHMLALGVAWALAGNGPRRLWLRWREKVLRRRLDKARQRFEVIDTRSPPGPGPKPKQWLN